MNPSVALPPEHIRIMVVLLFYSNQAIQLAAVGIWLWYVSMCVRNNIRAKYVYVKLIWLWSDYCCNVCRDMKSDIIYCGYFFTNLELFLQVFLQTTTASRGLQEISFPKFSTLYNSHWTRLSAFNFFPHILWCVCHFGFCILCTSNTRNHIYL